MPRKTKKNSRSRSRSKSRSRSRNVKTVKAVKAIKNPAPRFRKIKSSPRLSARHYYDNTGNVGDSCIVSNKLKKLLVRNNGSPYWQTCTANVEKNYGKCILNCKDPAGK